MRDLKVMFTKFVHEDGPLTKRIILTENGRIEKTVAAHFQRGRFESVSITSAPDLAQHIIAMKTNEALSYSVSVGADTGRVVTQKALSANRSADTVARTKRFFDFRRGQPGVLCLDHDAPNTGGFDRDELFGVLNEVAPELASAASVWMPSAGSCIWHGDEELIGVRGQRILILVKDAGDIPRAGKALLKRLWLHGYGHIDLSSSGAMLERTIFDGAVWDSARLDFVSGSVVEPPLEQRRGSPIVQGNGYADTFAALPDLNNEEAARYDGLVASAKQAREFEARAVRAAWNAARVDDQVTRLVSRGMSRDAARAQAENTVAQIERGTLLGDWPIVLVGGDVVTIAEILQDKKKFDGAECFDPLEPKYQGGKLCAKLFLFGARPVLHSFARGSTTYRLCPQPRKFVLSSRNTENVERILDDVRVLGDVFTTGGGLVVVDAGGVRPLGEMGVVQALSTQYAFFRIAAKGDEIPTDFPERAAKMLLAGNLSEFQSLRGVLTAPFMTLDGRIVSERGYDRLSGHFLEYDPEAFPIIPDNPSMEEIRDAYQQLWSPFSGFPFAEDEDRGGMLAALLTAVVRPGLDVAPGFFFEAPIQGSGKTLAAECVKILATGVGGVETYVPGEEEIRKKLVAWIRRGRLCTVIDNVTGRFSSGVLAGAMTTGILDGERVLGASTEITSEIRMLWLATGNNASMDRDFAERWIRIRIDAEMERPSERRFGFSPRFEVEQRRFELVAAALTILRGWHLAGRPDLTQRGCRFGQWSDSVRQCVLWLTRVLALPHGDPATSLFDTSADTETSELSEFLQALRALIDGQLLGEAFTAGELCTLITKCYAEQTQIAEVSVVEGWLAAHTTRHKPTPQSVGRSLGNITGRRCDALVLQQARPSTKRTAMQWCLSGAPIAQPVAA